MARTLPKRRLLPPENPESLPSVKRIRRAPEPTSTRPLPKTPTSTRQPESSSAEACPPSCIISCLLSVQEARAVLNNPKAVKGPFTNLPIVNLPELFNIIEMRSKRVLSTLPWGEHYALIDGELGRIKLVSEKRKLCKAKKQAKASIHKRAPRRVGVSPARGDESRAQFLLSQFKKKSALIKSGSEPRPQSPKPVNIESGPIPSTTRELGRGANGPPPEESSRIQNQSPLSQFRQSSALFNPSTPEPPPDDRPSSGGFSGTEKVVTLRTKAGHSHPVPNNIDPVVSKSPELEKFANRLSSLTVALYKAIELLPQMALQDLEGVLENDWMVEDMESTVMGVLSLVNGRDGEKQWRSGGGNGKL